MCKEKTYSIPSLLTLTNVIFLFDAAVEGNTSCFGSAIQVLPSDLAN